MYTLSLLGEVRLEDREGRQIPLRRHARALFAALALEPGRSRVRRSLAQSLWAGRDNQTAFGSLRQTLAQIRRECPTSPPLLSDQETIRLDETCVRIDVDRLCAIDAPAPLAEEVEGVGLRFLDAIDLNPEFDAWLAGRRSALETLVSRHVETVLDNHRDNDAGSRLAALWAQKMPRLSGAPQPSSPSAPSVPISAAAPADPLPHPATPPLLLLSPFTAVGAAAGGTSPEELRAELAFRLSRFHEFQTMEIDGTPTSSDRPAFLLTGSLHGAPGAQRLMVRLLSRPGHEILWADRVNIDNGLDDHLDRLAGLISCSMILEDTPDVERASAASGSFYARFIEYRMRALWPASHEEALDVEAGLRRLIAENPNFPFAYIALVRLLNTDYGYTRASSATPDKRDIALALAQQALAIDRNMPATWIHVGFCLLRRGEWAAAKLHIDQALALNDNDHTKLNIAATFYLYLGDLERSEQLLERSLSLMRAPGGDYMSDLGLLRLVQGRYLEAYDALLASPRPLLFTHVYLAVAAHLSGRDPRPIAAECRRRLKPIFGGGFEPSAAAINDWIASHHPFKDASAKRMLREGIAKAFA